MENLHDSTTASIKAGLYSLFGEYLGEERYLVSKGLMDVFVDIEGNGTSFIPQIDYKEVRHIEIPRDYDSGNDEIDRKFVKLCKENGLCDDAIKHVREDTLPKFLIWEEGYIDSVINNPKFKLEPGETIEEAIEKEKLSHFPFTHIQEKAVLFEAPRATYASKLKSTIYSMATQMPPYHINMPLYTSYIEACIRVMCGGMKMTNQSQIFFTFRVIANENKIVFFVCPLHPSPPK